MGLAEIEIQRRREIREARQACAFRNAIDELLRRAVNGPDGFRQRLYPGLPHDYSVSADVERHARELAAAGFDSGQIVRRIFWDASLPIGQG